MESYTWKISDPSLVKHLRAAEDCQEFFSPTFSMFNMRWQLKLIPTVIDEQVTKTQIFLHLRALPPKVHLLQIGRTYTMWQGDAKHSYDSEITRDKMYTLSWTKNDAISARQAIVKYSEYTFKVEVELLGAYDKEQNLITNQLLRSAVSPGSSSNAKLDALVTSVEKLSGILEEMQSRLEQIELKLDDAQKQNKGKNVKPRRKKIKFFVGEGQRAHNL